MKDYYNILGIPKTASADEVKKAYRKAAMKHHPDRNGGDDSEFKKIQEAYDVLSDNEKRAMVDQGMDPLNPNAFRSHHFGGGYTSMEDIFNNFGFNFNFGQQRQHPQRNRSMNVTMTLTLEEAFVGVNKSINVQYPSGNSKVINISIPQGVDNGMAIRYSGMGDDTIQGIPPGDLNIIINVTPHHRFAREGYNLLADVNIDCFDAILGTTVELITLDGRTLQITVPAGTQPNTTLGVKNEGMRDGKGIIGKLYLRVGITIPRNLDPIKQTLIEQLRN